MEKKDIKVVVAMSGGVDSSLAAALLKEEGYSVVGMFMKNWEEKDPNGVCQATTDFEDVIRVCNHIGIPYYSVNFSHQYWDEVFVRCLEEFKLGYTPNPDVLCNREIKFKVLLEKAFELGGNYLATGHYCRIGNDKTLKKGLDPNKDQSYFLYSLKKYQLEKVLFPIGHLPKKQVREMSKKLGLATADKKDSTGICFIGERKFKTFLNNFLPFQPGNMETQNGEVVGKHDGIAFYTIGQRKGLGIGGKGDAWFVVNKDVKRNVLIVEQGQNHPHLFKTLLSANQLTWIGDAPSAPFSCSAKIRYRQPEQACIIHRLESDHADIEFLIPQRAATPGQSIVFYQNDICLGGGVIKPS